AIQAGVESDRHHRLPGGASEREGPDARRGGGGGPGHAAVPERDARGDHPGSGEGDHRGGGAPEQHGTPGCFQRGGWNIPRSARCPGVDAWHGVGRRSQGFMEYVIGVDIGGTCTDCVVMDQQGQITIAKAFSTPQDFSAGILDALEVAAHQLGIDTRTLLSRTKLFLHGTTIAENAIVDGKLVTAGILVTRGFEDTLSLMRGAYAQWSGRTEAEMKNNVYARR